MSETKKVKVRIAVAVDPHGIWATAGIHGDTPADDREAFAWCCDAVGAGEKPYILTADLELPDATEVVPEIEAVVTEPTP